MIKVKHYTFLSVLLIACIEAGELSSCCKSGANHYSQTSTCTKIRLKKNDTTCVRTAFICCLSTLLDESCKIGTNLAKEKDSCSYNVNQVGGGLRKECCDCCLLAKDLLRQGKPCELPNGFSQICQRSFYKCCQDNEQLRFHSPPINDEGHFDSVGLMRTGDRCIHSKCEHLCTDRGGDNVICTCKPGYELANDGYSCLENSVRCALGSDAVSPYGTKRDIRCRINERCAKTSNGYQCISNNRNINSSLDNNNTTVEKFSFGHDAKVQAVARDMRVCPGGWQLLPSGQCVDVDECNLGSHDCGPLYQCRNTQGSYRCDPKKCNDGELMNPRTGECTSIECAIGYKPVNGRCEDVNECEAQGRCRQFEECLNTPGSFRCQERGNVCSKGYRLDRDTGFCVDINECTEGLHLCGDKQCINLPGSYKCRCSAGFEFNETTRQCEDIDECLKFAGHVCSLHATCENSYGSFKCHCKEGFTLASDGRNCDDIDECQMGIANCAQKCVNIPGSYQCICERGYRLGADGVTCEDIDECTLWSGTGDDLCMGSCINTPGSYRCQCPSGYEIQEDARTCKDIDECAKGECQGNDRICVNTLGSFKCHQIQCPPNYVHDKYYKNIVDDGYSCLKRCHHGDATCIGNHTREILYQFCTIPSLKVVRNPIEVSRVRAQMDRPFSVEYRIDKANRSKFLVHQNRNIGIIKVITPLKGPSTEIVHLHINTYSRSHVLLAHNVALITVYVSPYYF